MHVLLDNHFSHAELLMIRLNNDLMIHHTDYPDQKVTMISCIIQNGDGSMAIIINAK